MDSAAYARRQAWIRHPTSEEERLDRIRDYTPINERNKPCLWGCPHFNVWNVSCFLRLKYSVENIQCREAKEYLEKTKGMKF